MLHELSASTSTATIPATPLWRGLDYGPGIVVLAPRDGEPEVPSAWQPLEQRYQLAWCAVPDEVELLHRVEDVLETLADRNTRTHVVAHAALVDVAVRLVAEFPGTVRGIVLVGSGPEPGPTGVPVRRVAAGAADLSDAAVVREVRRALEAGDDVEPPHLRLNVPFARSGAASVLTSPYAPSTAARG
ncbi:hypothetical protein L6E12_00360 [Actinokineospora sp. PR83]|uniref:hypothetical protein n=1 Tax=Actinokineospora sp. PR83 TaxID=2884908 RepID=UPI001F48521C|nr:hypothetical protein [Actinokineospora sp. PR83]MCG8914251.1 hypothetical protein [Actinokineospora sp. PR83]